jgi:cytochrome c-type biogenesis protein CcmH/NrfG
MGEIALSQGKFASAVSHLKRASRSGGNARVLTLLGEAHMGAGQKGPAAEAFKKALQIDPDNARARDGYNEATGTR